MAAVPSGSPATAPRRLYKYRGFNVHSLRLMTEAEVYYADPKCFNDPLDCAPTIFIDVDLKTIERLCYRMLLEIGNKENAIAVLNHLRYLSTQYGDFKKDPDAEDYLKRLVATQVKSLVDAEMSGVGILSLTQRWDCPLMWSHYADEHRGICIEYDTTETDHPRLAAVSYRRPRGIRMSDILEWKTRKSTEAKERVHDTYFFAKAPQWRYEREWRDITDKSGTFDHGYIIKAIHFGLRCDEAVETSVVKLLNDVKGIKLYRVYVNDDSFRLKRQSVDIDETMACGVKSSVATVFRDVVLPDKE